MAYEYAYRLQSAPAGRADGSEQIDHDIFAIYRVQGSGTPWSAASVVPSYHKTILVPADDVETVMDMPDASGPQKQAKNQAYKQLLVDHRNDAPRPNPAPPVTDWSPSGIDAYLIAYEAWDIAFTAANAQAALQAGRANTYITVTLGLSYPIEFQV